MQAFAGTTRYNNNNAIISSPSTFGSGGNQIISAQPAIAQKSVHVTNNIANNNNNNINNNMKLIRQGGSPRSIGNVNNVYIQGSVQKVGKSNKYLVQQNQISHIILPPQQQMSTTQHNVQKLSTTSHQFQSHQAPPAQQQYHPQSPAGGGGNGNASGTIKYVNAQGNVIPPPNNHRYRTILQQSLTTSQSQPSPTGASPHFITADITGDFPPYQNQSSQLQHPSPTKQSTATNSVDDIIMVNGTHMSEEMSARILQSLSQKSMYNNNNKNNNNNRIYNSHQSSAHQPANFIQQPTNQYAKQKNHQPQRVYLTSTVNDYGSQPYQSHSSEHTSKNGPEYFRVKYVLYI